MSISVDLSKLRAEIDECDDQIRRSIRRRVELVRKIALVKAEAGKTMHDGEREQAILQWTQEVSCEVERTLFEEIYSSVFHSGKRLWEIARRQCQK